MRNKRRLFFLAILLLLVVGCSFNDNSKDETVENKVTIKGFYEEPESLKNRQTIVINGASEGEFVEIVVEGEIIDFEHVKMEWDANRNSLNEKEILKRFDRLVDQTVVIRTYMPEGIPSERLKWKSASGKAYEYTIQEDGVDYENNEGGVVFYLE
jgi:ABC-type oligopeptide transport system substrate-binding subunit